MCRTCARHDAPAAVRKFRRKSKAMTDELPRRNEARAAAPRSESKLLSSERDAGEEFFA